jgi:hypothetical protein
VEVAERFADGAASDAELASVRDKSSMSSSWFLSVTEPMYFPLMWNNVAEVALRAGAKWHRELEAICNLIRDIFGNPFRPAALNESWLTSDVVALAKGIYEERAFDRMPILADALQDAGCAVDEVLNHCRDAKQFHVRGCWVVDLLLGKG